MENIKLSTIMTFLGGLLIVAFVGLLTSFGMPIWFGIILGVWLILRWHIIVLEVCNKKA